MARRLRDLQKESLGAWVPQGRDRTTANIGIGVDHRLHPDLIKRVSVLCGRQDIAAACLRLTQRGSKDLCLQHTPPHCTRTRAEEDPARGATVLSAPASRWVKW